MPEFYLRALKQSAPFDALSDCEYNMLTFYRNGILLIKLRVKLTGLILDRGTFLKYNRLNLSFVRLNDFLRTPAVLDCNILIQCLCDFLLCRRHAIPVLQTVHCHITAAEPVCGSCTVNCYISAADYYNPSAHLLCIVFRPTVQEAYCNIDALRIIARNLRDLSALASDCYVKCLVAFLPQFIQYDILTDFYAAFDLHTQLPEHIDLCFDYVLFQLIGWNTISHHTSRTRIFLKYRRLIALHCQIVSRGKTCRTCADDRDFLIPLGQPV